MGCVLDRQRLALPPLVLVGAAVTNVLGAPIVYINDLAWSYFGLKASRSKQPFALASLGSVCPKQ
jgi:hypothetical protein